MKMMKVLVLLGYIRSHHSFLWKTAWMLLSAPCRTACNCSMYSATTKRLVTWTSLAWIQKPVSVRHAVNRLNMMRVCRVTHLLCLSWNYSGIIWFWAWSVGLLQLLLLLVNLLSMDWSFMLRATNSAITFMTFVGHLCLSVHAMLWVKLSMFRLCMRCLNLVLRLQLLAKLQLALVKCAPRLGIWRQNLVKFCKMHLWLMSPALVWHRLELPCGCPWVAWLCLRRTVAWQGDERFVDLAKGTSSQFTMQEVHGLQLAYRILDDGRMQLLVPR